MTNPTGKSSALDTCMVLSYVLVYFVSQKTSKWNRHSFRDCEFRLHVGCGFHMLMDWPRSGEEWPHHPLSGFLSHWTPVCFNLFKKLYFYVSYFKIWQLFNFRFYASRSFQEGTRRLLIAHRWCWYDDAYHHILFFFSSNNS